MYVRCADRRAETLVAVASTVGDKHDIVLSIIISFSANSGFPFRSLMGVCVTAVFDAGVRFGVAIGSGNTKDSSVVAITVVGPIRSS